MCGDKLKEIAVQYYRHVKTHLTVLSERQYLQCCTIGKCIYFEHVYQNFAQLTLRDANGFTN